MLIVQDVVCTKTCRFWIPASIASHHHKYYYEVVDAPLLATLRELLAKTIVFGVSDAFW